MFEASSVFGYVAYLLAVSNSTSIEVAKYNINDRYELIENIEYAYSIPKDFSDRFAVYQG